jgi:ubiquinone/menaquinone biosynthesis C-methylase UbiE
MQSKTTISTLGHWRTAPSIDTLRSLYDASADHWDDYLARLGQHQDYQRLFKSRAVRHCLNQLDHTSKILDCGMGTGAFSLGLLDSIAHPVHVSGVDISYPMLTHAQQHLETRCPALDLRWGDIRRLPFADAAFDAVIFAHVLEHLADPIAALNELARVLKPGAPLIGSVTRKGLGQVLMSLRWHNRGYASHQLDACLKVAGLDAVRTFDYGTGWSRWMCIAAISVKPGRAIAQAHPDNSQHLEG